MEGWIISIEESISEKAPQQIIVKYNRELIVEDNYLFVGMTNYNDKLLIIPEKYIYMLKISFYYTTYFKHKVKFSNYDLKNEKFNIIGYYYYKTLQLEYYDIKDKHIFVYPREKI